MNSIIKHLANLKLYSEFKKSQAKSFDHYIEFISCGSPKEFDWFLRRGTTVTEKFTYRDPLLDQESEDKVESFLEKKQSENNEPKLDLSNWYKHTEFLIEDLFEKYSITIVLRKNPFEVLDGLLYENEELNNLISTSADDFYHYLSLMQGKPPEDFCIIFSDNTKNIEDYPLIDCYPRIFSDCKSFAFFKKLNTMVENGPADFSYIFYQMRTDKLIHFHCKPEFETLINLGSKDTIEIYSENKILKSKFKSTYSQFYNKMF